jgi:starch-binding outer membrane protein, SusD/RagB family
MRKTLLYILISLAVATGFSSCNDWLTVLPENDQVADEYWQSKEDVEAVIASCYVSLRATEQQQFIWGELRGNSVDLTNYIYMTQLNFTKWNILPDNDLCKWDKWYKIINMTNMVIAYSPAVRERDASFSESVMNSYIAEAHYIRGLAYFFLVRNFREVPLILEPYMNDNQSYDIPQASESAIWDQITEDLIIAEAGCKTSFSEPDTWANKGRATKWAAKATLADVYLWTGHYDKAITACNDLINSGKVGLIPGLINETENNWYSIFSTGNTNEGIFELQWNYEDGQLNTTLFNMFGGTNYNYMISLPLYQQYILNPGDFRGLNATYQLPSGKFWKYIGISAGNSMSSSEYGITRSTNEQDQNWIMYRMADVLLMKAEALIMTGESGYDEAIGLINKVRKRAQLTTMVEKQTSEAAMLDLLLDERWVELAGEGKRWYDLLRVAKRNDYKYLDYMIDEVLKNASPSNASVISSILKDKNSHYLPIYYTELENNKALVQNPFYDNLY